MMTHPFADMAPAGPAQSEDRRPSRHVPVLFLSDLHLGSRACRETMLLDFLQRHSADTIYLVGDIIDTWMPARHWTPVQQRILGLILARAKTGTRIVYTPGNHDAFFRRFIGEVMLGVEVQDRLIHQAADGRRYLVVHGDEGDIFERRFPRITRLVARVDGAFRAGVAGWNRARARLGLAPSTLAERVVKLVNDAARACDAFEERLGALARAAGADGIICGHFHKPALHGDHGVIYANCGDWVENASALVETQDGGLMLIDWTAQGVEIPAPHVHIGLKPVGIN